MYLCLNRLCPLSQTQHWQRIQFELHRPLATILKFQQLLLGSIPNDENDALLGS